jgi:hypothetical protein
MPRYGIRDAVRSAATKPGERPAPGTASDVRHGPVPEDVTTGDRETGPVAGRHVEPVDEGDGIGRRDGADRRRDRYRPMR